MLDSRILRRRLLEELRKLSRDPDALISDKASQILENLNTRHENLKQLLDKPVKTRREKARILRIAEKSLGR